MKILIGTPIHQIKDYSMERWLANITKIDYPADLLLIDNSPNDKYIQKVDGYCKKFNITNYKAKHINLEPDLRHDMRIEISQETIRQYVLTNNYDAWFSWECDQIIPADALSKLVKIMLDGNYLMVVHNSHARWDQTIANMNMGCTLIRKEALKKNSFLPSKNGVISRNAKDGYDINDPRVYKNRILFNQGNYVEVHGIIKTIKHLNS